MFIVIEGPNGAGKTSLIKNISKNPLFQTLSSPNGTPLAKMLRPACRGAGEWSDLSPKVKFLLFSAARMDEYLRIVAAKPNENIVADRWWTSTFVYQVVFEGLPLEHLENTIHPEEKIDLVVRLDASDETLAKRVFDERSQNPSHGLCSWTKQDETMRKIASIYRNELPFYLNARGIKEFRIDTTSLNEDEVYCEFLRAYVENGFVKKVP